MVYVYTKYGTKYDIIFCIICISLIHVEFAYAEDHSIETHDSQSGIDIILKDQSLIVEKYATGFEWPTSFGFIENDMFVLEKNSGKIFLIKDESAEKELVLEIDVSKGKEEGLLGILTRDTTAYIHYTTRNSDDGATPNWFSSGDKIKKTFILWYKRNQILNLDEEFKGYDTSSLKKIYSSIGLKKHPKDRKKLIYQMKEKIMKKDWKSIDKLYKRIKRN